MIPIYVADFAKKVLRNKAIVALKSERDWVEMTEEYEFQFSLYPNDLVKVKKKNGPEIITYYRGTDRSTAGIIVLKNPNINCTEKYGSKTLEVFEKYQVDILGNISKVKKEKRRGIEN